MMFRIKALNGIVVLVCIVAFFCLNLFCFGPRKNKYDVVFLAESDARLGLWLDGYASKIDSVREAALLEEHEYFSTNKTIEGREHICLSNMLFTEERLAQFYEKRTNIVAASRWRSELSKNYIYFTNVFGKKVIPLTLNDISNIVVGTDRELNVQ